MNHKAIFTSLLASLICAACMAQDHLPAFTYSRKPAVLNARIVGDNAQNTKDISVSYTMKYSAGMGDARRGKDATPDADGLCSFSLRTGTTVKCTVSVGDIRFNCYVIPGDTVSFALDTGKALADGLADAITFSGPLARFNHDLVYASQQGFDPNAVYMDIEMKRNSGKLAAELPECSFDGYIRYLDSIRQSIDRRILNDPKIGEAYREYATAVNHYGYGEAVPACAYAIRYAGLDTEEKYEVFARRMQQWLENYIQDDPWSNPVLSYVMWCTPETMMPAGIRQRIKLPESYSQCHLASKHMMLIGQQSQLLSEAQKDSILTFMPDLGQDVLDFNEKLERKLAVINDHGKSRICTLPDDRSDSDDMLSAITRPYRGLPVLIDLWETTCGPCRIAFRDMHKIKAELSGRMHFVNIASERSDLAVWEKLVPSFIGDHYRLTEEQLLALHRQIPCPTDAVPLWVLLNADGTIHHAFVGWSNADLMMKELEPVLN